MSKRISIVWLLIVVLALGCSDVEEDRGELIAGIPFADPVLKACLVGHGLEHALDVMSIDCEMQAIGSLNGLEHFKDVGELFLSRNQIVDLTPLSDLYDVRRVFFDDNRIVQLQGLAKMTDLGEASLARNAIVDLTPLASCESLGWLVLGDNQISDLTPLEGLNLLQTLAVEKNQISDISPLSKLPALRYLGLWQNQISDLTPLSNSASLIRLSLSENRITDVAPLKTLVNLTDLALDWQFNQVEPGVVPQPIVDVSPLAAMVELRTLYIDGNHITNVASLTALSKLQLLSVSHNKLTDASQFAGFAKTEYLRVLNLAGNDLRTGVTTLSNLQQLEILDLSDNPRIPCADLDAVEKALEGEVLVRPDTCHQPIAVPGDLQVVVPGSTVQLDGSGSGTELDEQGNVIGQDQIISYTWTLEDKPFGSTAALSNPAIANPTFVADLAGRYKIALVVNDGTGDSEPVEIGVIAQD